MPRLIPLIIAALALAGCGGTIVSETFTEVGESLPSPSAAASDVASPSASAAAADGTISLVAGVIADGPGESIADAIARGSTEPTLVNGALMLDAEGTIWLCESVDQDTTPPQCGEPRLVVENFPEGTATFDMDSADLTGAQEADGVVWLENQQLYGVVQP